MCADKPFTIKYILVWLLLFSLIGLSGQLIVNAQGPCGATYIVQPGDTLSEIAELCATEVGAILDLNPEISDPGQIFTGQILRIPEVEAFSGPIVAISPDCGLPGTPIIVIGSGFPPNESVQITAGQINQPASASTVTTSDEFGTIDATISVPASAVQEATWVVTAETRISSARFVGISNEFSLVGSVPDPNASTTYEVISGDTLNAIADKFNRNPTAIIQANPGMSDSDPLTIGQIIFIPARERGFPGTTASPICGPPETTLAFRGDDFPPGANLALSIGRYLAGGYQPVKTIRVNTDRTVSTDISIPPSARPGEHWVLMSVSSTTPTLRSSSNLFSVTPTRNPNKQRIYFVRSGDTLNEISITQNRSVTSILSANPQITNPNQLEFGERLVIPPQNEAIVLTPSSGEPGEEVQVNGIGFPASSSITLGLGRVNSSYNIIGTIQVDAVGIFRTQALIPLSARTGENWVVVSVRSTASGSQVGITSNEFTITRAILAEDPQLTIWPTSGEQGSQVYLVAANFPPMSQLEYSIGRSIEDMDVLGSTWTEVNGTLAVVITIPTEAEVGEEWIFGVETVAEPQVEAISPVFTVVEAEEP